MLVRSHSTKFASFSKRSGSGNGSSSKTLKDFLFERPGNTMLDLSGATSREVDAFPRRQLRFCGGYRIWGEGGCNGSWPIFKSRLIISFIT